MNESLEKPKARENVTLQDIGDEVIIYDSEKENVHILNNTAYAIWNLCDGEHTIEDIHEHLERKFPDIAAETDLIEDIKTTLNEFLEKKLII